MLSTTAKEVISTEPTPAQPHTNDTEVYYGPKTTTLAPVPNDSRGPELTFAETGYDKTFMFAQNNTFIQMDGDLIQTFQLR
jgi:hypothetical protein